LKENLRREDRRPSLPGYASFVRWKQATTELNYGREIVRAWARAALSQAGDSRDLRVLDVGCGPGADLVSIRAATTQPLELVGIESHPLWAATAESNGIDVFPLDVEREALPLDDRSVDFAIANQVLEHTKDVFWIVSEVHRVLRPGGHFCIGVPNLASLHNRLLLLLGEQPSSIEVVGPHVRGFTLRGLRRFLEFSGHFRVEAVAGGNFYPLPRPAALRVARLWPSAAVSIFVLVRKTSATGSFLETITADMDRATPFFRG
jgi:SAM-dependent methyltransferase